MKPLISIAMCTYNGEKFIKEQLDSIIQQSYENLEIIIVDDCSFDGTADILEDIKKIDKRIVLYRNEQNLGFIKNFEKAISLCSGEYIALADQDDIWKHEKIKLFEKKIKDNVLIYSDAIFIDKYSNELGNELIRSSQNLCRGACNKAFLLTNFLSGNTIMFKKELVEHILPIPEKISYHDIWIAFVASTYGSIEFTEESMTYYRRYAEQVTNRENIVHDSFFKKLKYKKESRIKAVEARLTDLKLFKSLVILRDKNTIEIVDLLIEHYQNYENTYFNKKLYIALRKNLNEVFASFRKQKRAKVAFRTALGLKFRTMTLFKI